LGDLGADSVLTSASHSGRNQAAIQHSSRPSTYNNDLSKMESQSGDKSQSSIAENITHIPRNSHNLPLEPHLNDGPKAYIWLGFWLIVVWWMLSRACESAGSTCHLDVRLRMHNSSCVVDIVRENCRGYGSQSVVCHSGDGKENVSLHVFLPLSLASSLLTDAHTGRFSCLMFLIVLIILSCS
jgi:hypothetical protein